MISRLAACCLTLWKILFSFATVLLRYLANLSKGRLILWCYFIWYLVVLVRYFDPSLRLWLTSLGLSLIIGFAQGTVECSKHQIQLSQSI